MGAKYSSTAAYEPAPAPGPPLSPQSAATTPRLRAVRAPICSAIDTVAFDPLPALPSPQGQLTPHSHGSNVTDIWIIAGQSNAVGENAADPNPIPDVARQLPDQILAFSPEGHWTTASPNLHLGTHGYSAADSVGPDMAFGRTILSLGLCSRVGLIPTAKGATNLHTEWSPGGGLYRAMLDKVRTAMSAPLPGGGTPRLRGMLFVQGEADAEDKPGGAEAAAAWGAHFGRFVAAIRRDLGACHPQLPIVMGVMPTQRRSYFVHIETVRKQQLALQLPGVMKVDMAGFEFIEEYGGQMVHLSKAAACALGAAMAHVYYANVVRGRPMLAAQQQQQQHAPLAPALEMQAAQVPQLLPPPPPRAHVQVEVPVAAPLQALQQQAPQHPEQQQQLYDRQGEELEKQEQQSQQQTEAHLPSPPRPEAQGRPELEMAVTQGAADGSGGDSPAREGAMPPPPA